MIVIFGARVIGWLGLLAGIYTWGNVMAKLMETGFVPGTALPLAAAAVTKEAMITIAACTVILLLAEIASSLRKTDASAED